MDAEENRLTRRTLGILCLATMAAAIPAMVGGFETHWSTVTSALMFFELCLAASAVLNWRKKPECAAKLICFSCLCTAAALAWKGGFQDEAMLMFPAMAVVGAMLLDWRLYRAFAVLTVATVAALGVVQKHGLSPATAGVGWDVVLNALVILSISALAAGLLARSLKQSTSRLHETAASLQAVVNATNCQGAGFFDALVSELARVLGVKAAMVAELLPEQPSRARTIAAWSRGDKLENFDFELAAERFWSGQRDSEQQIPDSALVRQLGFTSYLGTPLNGCSGKALGLMAILDDRPIQSVALAQTLLTAFAGRAATELERQRADQALQESEDRYRTTLENLGEGVFIVDREQRVLDANRAAEQIAGVAAGSFIGRDLKQMLLPSELPKLEKELARRVRGEKSTYEIEIVRGDGRTCKVQVTSTAQFDKTGQFIGSVGVCRDVTERAKTENQLTLLAHALRSAGDCITIADADERLIYVNDALLSTYGYTETELLGQRSDIFRSERNPPDVNEKVLAGTHAGGWRGQLWNRAKDGREFPIALTTSVVRDCRGGIVATVGVAREISDQIQAERSLRESEERFRSLSNASLEGIMIHERGVILDANLAFARLFGYERPEDLIGKDGPELVLTPESRERIRRRMERHETGVTEVTGVRKNGATFAGETESQPIKYLGRDASLVACRDITERKRAVEALRESEERYKALFDRSLDCVFLIDFDGHFLDANQAALDVLGYRREDIAALTFESLLTEDQLPGARRTIEEIRATGHQRNPTEYRLRGKDGGEVSVETQSSLIYREGKPFAIQGIARDITGRKRAEEEKAKLQAQLHQAQKMESIGRLAGGVAHDFNNLLTVINGYSRLLLAGLSEGDPLQGALSEIHKAGERAAGLTGQLLAFSRKQILQPRALDLNRVVEEMRPMLARLVGEDVEVRIALHAESGMVYADPHQLEQVVMNLAVNARDAMPGGGGLLIETAGVERDDSYAQPHAEARAGRCVVLAVTDSGTGMDEATRQRIFEPFFTTKEAGKGTGLGLSMVQGIVEQSGGHVEVYSEPGRGTTFKIYLPALGDAAADTGTPAGVAAPGGKETVLVVEDQAEVRQFAAAALGAYGYQVMQAGNADEALSLCERERIDLVLTDVVMPNVSGRELANRLRERRPRIKVLFMSGYSDDAIIPDGVLERGAEFIPKPFSPDQLAIKVREMLAAPDRPARIVVADDEAGVRSFLRTVLESGGYEVVEAADGKQALKEAREGGVDLVIGVNPKTETAS